MARAMDDLTTLLATPARFRRWLESADTGALVGEPSHAERCPLATWLCAEGHAADVGRAWVWVASGPLDYRDVYLPPWARYFVRRVDLGAVAVTAGLALAYLDEEDGDVGAGDDPGVGVGDADALPALAGVAAG